MTPEQLKKTFVGTWAFNGDEGVQIVVYQDNSGELNAKLGPICPRCSDPKDVSYDGKQLHLSFFLSPRCTYALGSANRLDGNCGYATRIGPKLPE